ncbi:MAG TPA: MotA/TolQ/ExbB proton channel family protein [Bacteroidales bacterium]|jgi:biopolymer transport protein ExbB|nr:MotA/TolQ/ExbB proton channel family protein [Bacteroidales bacterium]
MDIILFTNLAQPAVQNGPVTSWFDLVTKGGLIMIPILLLSFVSVYIFIERYLYIRKASSIDSGLVPSIVREIGDGHVDRALIHARKDPSAAGRIMESGLAKFGKPARDIESNLESATNLEITKMEKNTGYLGIIAGIAPMLGFIGTISGVIKIFYSISLADNISIGIISGGLYQKMICSGAGLIVGVISYAAYHILQMKIDRYTISLQESLLNFINRL